MKRQIFEPEHDHFRESVRAFIRNELVPHTEEWERTGMVDRGVWKQAAELGFVGFEVPEEYGGSGLRDFRFNAVLGEEMAYALAVGDNFALQNDIVHPYLIELTTEEQRRRWLPPATAGDLVAAIAMSEPSMGSDLRAMRTTATPTDAGFLLNGSKTFVTSGIQADLVIVAAKMRGGERDGKMSLFGVDPETPGFRRGRKLDKVGRRAQDTAELFFEDVEVPHADLIGELGLGLDHLKQFLPQERLSQAVGAVAAAEAALQLTIEYCKERTAFGKAIGSHQANRFYLAEMKTEIDVGRTYIDRCTMALLEEELSGDDAAAAKLYTTEMQCRVLDRCLQLHGGYGYMEEYPIARLWRDGRVQRIYGGTSEILKEIIGRSMGF